MSVVGILDDVTAWVQEAVCSQIKLKMPPEDREPDDAGYAYQRISPTAFALYLPAKDKLPPSVLSPFPSVCVRFLAGADNMAASQGSVGIELLFSTWNPGTHGKDILLPNLDDPLRPIQWTGEEANAYFQRLGDGWRDAWNFVDIALREIESRTEIAGYQIDRSVPVKFGPLAEQEAIPDFYPFWFAWASFTLTYPLRRNRSFEQFL